MTDADLQNALKELFEIYDIDEGGDIDSEEFNKIEINICNQEGIEFRTDMIENLFHLTDTDKGGSIDLPEFSKRYIENVLVDFSSKQQQIDYVKERVKLGEEARREMGVRVHTGIRKQLKALFSLYDANGDGGLDPQEWINGQKVIAQSVADDIDPDWFDAKSFTRADTSGDGIIQLEEFLASNFDMLEMVSMSAEDSEKLLQKIASVLAKGLADVKDTGPIKVLVFGDNGPNKPVAKLQFCSPLAPVQEHGEFNEVLEIKFPLNFKDSAETQYNDFHEQIRMALALPADAAFDVFYKTAEQSNEVPIQLVNKKVTEKGDVGNLLDVVDYLMKDGAHKAVWVKNIRVKPDGLEEVECDVYGDHVEPFLTQCEEHDRFAIDWQSICVVGKDVPLVMECNVGDAIVIEVPAVEEGEEKAHDFTHRVFMQTVNGEDVLSKPCERIIAPKAKAKGKKPGAPISPDAQIHWLAQNPGKAKISAEISWVKEESKLLVQEEGKDITQPMCFDSVGVIPAIIVRVNGAKSEGKGNMTWWDGAKYGKAKPKIKAAKKK